jgi:hypothetical protein
MSVPISATLARANRPVRLAIYQRWRVKDTVRLVIRAKRAGMMLPVLEAILSEFGRRPAASDAHERTTSSMRNSSFRAHR